MTAMQTNLMQCAAYGLSTDRLTPTPSTSAAMLAALIHLFPKHNLWIWHWAHALNFFGWPWQGLFWVEPVLLNRWMVFGHRAAAQFQGLGNLDINGCVLSYFEGTAHLYCYTSCTLTTLHCSKVSFLQCCHMKKHNKISKQMWGVYSLLWDSVNI